MQADSKIEAKRVMDMGSELKLNARIEELDSTPINDTNDNLRVDEDSEDDEDFDALANGEKGIIYKNVDKNA